MAHSPGSAERRAHLIREMARQNDRSRDRFSAASSVASGRDSNPPYDTFSQQLPAVPANVDFQINTSALRRAFPNFSQHGSSDEDSIEVGRGARRSAKSTPSRNLPSEDPSENLSLDIGDGFKYRVVATPPMKPRNPAKPQNDALKSNQDQNINLQRTTSEKENQDPLKKTTEYGSNTSSKGSLNDRRTLAEIHARVESDDCMPLGEVRASDLNAAAKQSRFSSNKAKQAKPNVNSLNTVTNTEDLLGPKAGVDRTGSGNNGTHQSFLLPDLPNITELVSGVRQDGTPLFTRSAKSRSRFGTPGTGRRSHGSKLKHAAIEDIATPIDEKVLYVSLQLLQERVATLENEKAQSDSKLEEYELEVLQLRSKLEEHETYPYINDNHGNGIEEIQSRGKRSEKTKLEHSMKTLQDRLDRANQKVSDSENMIKNLTKDRDAAHQQLAMAYLGSEELKTESEALRQEISTIKSQLAKLTRQHERRIEKLTIQESELRAKIERREKAVNEMGHLAKELWDTRRALSASGILASAYPSGNQPSGRAQSSMQSVTNGNANSRSKGNDEKEQLRSRSRSRTSIRDQGHGRRASAPESAVGEADLELASEGGSTINIRIQPDTARMASASGDDQLTKDPTFLSFMEGDEVAKLRRIVDEDKAKLRDSGYESIAVNVEGATQSATERRIPNSNVLPRKSSLKDPSKNRKHVQYQDDDNTGHFTFDAHSMRLNSNGGVVRDDLPVGTSQAQRISFTRQDTQQSIASQASVLRRRRGSANGPAEMTSAFILPDITLDSAGLTWQGKQDGDLELTKQTRTIPRPVPVSDRPQLAHHNEEDPTTRPSQPPGLALATVLKDLEDELARLRARLVKQESLYHQQDPALSKHRRKSVHAKMQKLLAAIEVRSDQIYALYDVLEGQKAKGQTMEESEVEVTLQIVGLDPARLKEAKERQANATFGAGRATSGADEVSDDEDGKIGSDGDESDGELPWEGLEPTQTQTLESLRAFRVR